MQGDWQPDTAQRPSSATLVERYLSSTGNSSSNNNNNNSNNNRHDVKNNDDDDEDEEYEESRSVDQSASSSFAGLSSPAVGGPRGVLKVAARAVVAGERITSDFQAAGGHLRRNDSDEEEEEEDETEKENSSSSLSGSALPHGVEVAAAVTIAGGDGGRKQGAGGAAAAGGSEVAVKLDGNGQARPGKGHSSSMNTPEEAQRRLEAMYAPRWRSGMSEEQHRRVLSEEDAALEDFDRIFPIPLDYEGKPSSVPDFDQLMEFAFDHDDRRLKRFAGPLPRGDRYTGNKALDGGGIGEGPSDATNGMGGDNSGSRTNLPPLNGADPEERNIFGDPFKRGEKAKAREAKDMPKPGPKQAAAAERLMKGYSSLRTAAQSGEGSGGGGGGKGVSAGGAGGVGDGFAGNASSALYRLVQPGMGPNAPGVSGYPGEVIYDERGVPLGIVGPGGELLDGMGMGFGDLGVRFADQSTVAKHWRQKSEQSRRQRQSNTVALKPKVRQAIKQEERHLPCSFLFFSFLSFPFALPSFEFFSVYRRSPSWRTPITLACARPKTTTPAEEETTTAAVTTEVVATTAAEAVAADLPWELASIFEGAGCGC